MHFSYHRKQLNNTLHAQLWPFGHVWWVNALHNVTFTLTFVQRTNCQQCNRLIKRCVPGEHKPQGALPSLIDNKLKFKHISSQGQRSRSNVKVKCHQNLITFWVHRNPYSCHVHQFLFSSFFQLLCRQTNVDKNETLFRRFTGERILFRRRNLKA